MIKATMFETVCELRILARDNEEFAEDLLTIKGQIAPIDRKWNEQKKVWVVKNPHNYMHLKFIATAIAESTRQGRLF